ncbi:Arm DNA-binding domain-containing protein [Salipiger pallidus]|uniref:Arm DNA-binding domain-containing protein n=1 Tax=Salipiger pallidus TaxID=1775170 RepID=UPI003570C78D
MKRLRHPGAGGKKNFAMGGPSGLQLQLTPKGGRTWVLRVSIASKRHEIGLGGYPDVPLAEARDRAREIKGKIWRGINPREERKAAQSALAAAERRGMTFRDAVEKWPHRKVGCL